MKHGVSLKAKVLELRRGHSLREVSSLSGLPLGTVKTICARSGAFKDNPRLRELFSLAAHSSVRVDSTCVGGAGPCHHRRW
jgi:hypothetical protein